MHGQTLAFLPRLRTFAVAALLAVPSFADVYVVDFDGGPGADFTDLPAAVAATMPGDVLLVHSGPYSGFQTSKGIAILAQGDNVKVNTAASFSSVPFGQVVRVLGVKFATLDLSSCQGVVVLDGVTVTGDSAVVQDLNVVDCADVRVIGSLFSFSSKGGSPGAFSGHALKAFGARVEVVDSQLYGRHGFGSGGGDGSDGGHGALITNSSRLHMVLTASRGGNGGQGSVLCFPIFLAGTGGDGARVDLSGTLFAMGTPSVSSLIAGAGGPGNPNCSIGSPGDALDLRKNSFARHSGQTINGATSVDATSMLETPALLDPYMERSGTPLVGTQVRFNVFGEAGDVVTLFLGRNAVVQPLPGVLIEKLTSEERAFPLGAIPAGGFATFAFNLPPTMTAGFTFYAQARVLRGSEEFRTNSIPVVVR